MTADLDAALHSGETIVYRTRGRSYAGPLIYYGIMLLAIALFSSLNAILMSPEEARLAKAAVMMTVGGGGTAAILVVLLISKWWQWRDPDDLALTDRRLLFANSEWDDKLESLRLDQIEQVSWVAERGIRHLTVIGSDRTIRLSYLREANAAAKRIADAAGIAAPPALCRIGVIESTHLGIVPAAFAVYLGLIALLGSFGLFVPGSPLSLEFWWLAAIFTATMLVAFLLGAPIGVALTLALLRPFISAEQLQTAICAGKRDRWHIRLALKWASLLYGRRLRFVAC